MKNILIFIESLSGGGAEKVLTTILKHIDYTKNHITLLTLTDIGILKSDINFSKIEYRTVIKQSNNLIYQLYNKIKYKLIYQYLPAYIVNTWIIPKGEFDLYIAFTEGYCTKILAHTSKQKFAWVHIDLKALSWTIDEGIYKNKLEEKIAYSKYDKVICVSNSVKRIMQEEYGLEQVETIYNPIDTKEIITKSKEINNADISDGFNLISIGRLVPQKGYDLLIPIISKLVKEGISVHLYILGTGVEKEKLENIITAEGMNDNIHLLGFQRNPYSFMKKMNLFVCSSRSEGYSLVIAEALTLELPVISMNCSGPNELLDNNKYGILCDSYEELYQALRNATTDKNYYQTLKDKAAKRKDFFDISSDMRQIEKLLNE